LTVVANALRIGDHLLEYMDRGIQAALMPHLNGTIKKPAMPNILQCAK